MHIVVYMFVFIVGLFFGSFYNVVALRAITGESISLPPSHCTACNHRLGPLDLFPVFSYLFLGGKCRYCKDKISFVYPLGELLTAVGYTLVVYRYGFTLISLAHIVFITIMVISTTSDIKSMEIPDKFIIIGLVLTFLIRLLNGDNILTMIMNTAVPFLALYIIFLLSGGRMGGADVKIYALIGLNIGIVEGLGSLFYASFVALMIMVPMMLISKEDMKQKIPFFPFITIGVMLTYVYSVTNFLL